MIRDESYDAKCEKSTSLRERRTGMNDRDGSEIKVYFCGQFYSVLQITLLAGNQNIWAFGINAFQCFVGGYSV